MAANTIAHTHTRKIEKSATKNYRCYILIRINTLPTTADCNYSLLHLPTCCQIDAPILLNLGGQS